MARNLYSEYYSTTPSSTSTPLKASVIDRALTKETQEKVKEKALKRPVLTEIGDFIDNLERPLYSATSWASELNKQIREGKSFHDLLTDKGGELEAAKKRGWDREEKKYFSDVFKEVFPESYQKIHEATRLGKFQEAAQKEHIDKFGDTPQTQLQLSLLGLDDESIHKERIGLDENSDLLSAPLFVADLVMDPINLIPVGGLPKVLGALKTTSTKTLLKVGETVSPKLTEKALEHLSTIQDGFNHVFNARGIFEKYLRSIKGFEAVRKMDAVAKSTANTFMNFLQKIGLKTEADSISLNKGLQSTSDVMQGSLQSLRAKEIGIHVHDLMKFDEFTDVANQIHDLSNGGELAQKLGPEAPAALEAAKTRFAELTEWIKQSKSPELAQRVFEQHGMLSAVNEMKNVVKNGNKLLAKKRMETAIQYGQKLNTIVDEQMQMTKRFRNGSIQDGHKLLQAEIGNSISMVKELGKNVRSSVRQLSEQAPQNIKAAFEFLHSRIDGLGKYELDSMKAIEGIKGQKIISMKAQLNALQMNVLSLEKETAKDVRRQLIKRIEAGQVKLRNDLQGFFKDASSDMLSLKQKGVKVKAMNREALAKFDDEMVRLQAIKDKTGKMITSEKVMYVKNLKTIDKLSDSYGARIFKNLQAFQRGELNERVMNKWNKIKGKIQEKTIKQEVPEHLWPVAREVRKYFDDTYERLKEKGLVKGYVAGYFPRSVKAEDLEIISGNAFNRGSGGGSLKKSRQMMTEAEAQADAANRGYRFEDRAHVNIINAIEKAKKLEAKHLLESEVKARFGLKTMSDVPERAKIQNYHPNVPKEAAVKSAKEEREAYKHIQQEINYMFEPKGIVKTAEKVGKAIWKAPKSLLTVYNVKYHLGNLMSQPLLIMQRAGLPGALNIGNYADGLAVKFQKAGNIERKVGGKVESMSIKDFQKQVDDFGLLSHGFTGTEHLGPKNQAFKKYSVKNPIRWMLEATQFSQNIDDIGRLTATIAHWKQGKSLPEALEAAEKSMLDYNLTNSKVDKLVQGLGGFYSFTRRVIPEQIRAFVNDPKQYSIMSKVVEKISNREELTDEEIKHLSIYDRSSIKFLGELVDGMREVYSFNMLPASNAYQTLNSVLSLDHRSLIGQITDPTLIAALDFYYGEESNSGKDYGNYLPEKYSYTIGKLKPLMNALGLEEEERPRYENGVKVGTYTALKGNPWVIGMIRRVPYYSRQLAEASEAVEKADKDGKLSAAIGYITGMRKTKMDLKSQQFFDQLKVDEALKQKALTRPYVKSYSNIYIKKENRPKVKPK